MLSKYASATLFVAALANTQATHNLGDPCTGATSYCVGGTSGTTNIILRCDGTKLYAGNCNDNLNEPEFGALCIETSATSGDAYCSAVAGPSTTTAPTTSSTTSSAAGYSATGCPSTYDPTCAYYCGEAQVPFGLCESTDITGEFASCSKCPTAGAMTTTTPTTSPVSYTTTTPPVYTTPSSSVVSTSTCSPYSAAACPAVADPCCAYICGEAQVPFPVCQPTDGTGEFASCSKCPTMGSMTSAPSTYTTPTVVTTTSAPLPTTTVVPAGNGTSGNVSTSGVPSPTYIAGASSVAGGATIGLVVVMGFVGLMGML